MELEPSEIATKCTSLDSTQKSQSPPPGKTPPPTGPLPKPPGSALSKSLDNEAQRTSPFAKSDFMSGLPSPWSPPKQVRGGVSGLSNSFADRAFEDGPTSFPIGSVIPGTAGGQRRTNGSMSSMGTETVGFFVDEEAKQRGFASDVPFARSPRDRDSDVSAGTSVEDKKTIADSPQDADTPEAIAALERYGSRYVWLMIAICICCRLRLSLRGC